MRKKQNAMGGGARESRKCRFTGVEMFLGQGLKDAIRTSHSQSTEAYNKSKTTSRDRTGWEVWYFQLLILNVDSKTNIRKKYRKCPLP